MKRVFTPLRGYIASRWRDARHPAVLAATQAAGINCYDYRAGAFHFGDDWRSLTPAAYAMALDEDRRARAQFAADRIAIEQSDVVIALLPAGNSVHAEIGYAAGLGKQVILYLDSPVEPELMHLFASGFVHDMGQLSQVLTSSQIGDPAASVENCLAEVEYPYLKRVT